MKKAVAVVFDVVVVVVVVVGWPAPVFHVRAVPPKMEKKSGNCSARRNATRARQGWATTKMTYTHTHTHTHTHTDMSKIISDNQRTEK